MFAVPSSAKLNIILCSAMWAMQSCGTFREVRPRCPYREVFVTLIQPFRPLRNLSRNDGT